jgi:hypothetical protein
MSDIHTSGQDCPSEKEDLTDDASESSRCNLIVNYLPQEVDDASLLSIFEGGVI